MIQRIQTLYLFIIAVIAVLLIFTDAPYVEFKGFDKWTQGETGTVRISFNDVQWVVNDNVVQNQSIPLCTYTLGVIALLAGISIFLYKNRRLQMLLTAFNYIFILVLYILMIYNGYKYSALISVERETDIAMGLFFPFFLPVFNFMALRGMNHDERLVRSMDRLR